jgi:molybdopterin converting factor subunit 1
MKIKVLYFASLRDDTQTPEETIETAAVTIDELYTELNTKYQFNLDKDHLRVAQNEEYVNFNSSLAQRDTIVFIPPVAGG